VKRLVITTAAQRHIAEITAYIARESHSRRVANGFRQKLITKLAALAELQAVLGTERTEIGSGLRSTPFGNYLIFFRYEDTKITIVAVLHASRDVVSHFDKD